MDSYPVPWVECSLGGSHSVLVCPFLRLESQLMSDIQTILQLLQRQPTLGPPAYSTVTASPDYHRPAVKIQPVSLTASHFFSHTGTQVRIFSPLHSVFLFFIVRNDSSDYCTQLFFFLSSLKSSISWQSQSSITVSVILQTPTVS